MNAMKLKKIYIIIIVAIVTIVTSGLVWKSSVGSESFIIDTSAVEKGAVSNVITATGTLEATNTVVVGTQVSGVIERLYVDFNSNVKKGQLIAELDKSTLQSSLETSEADLQRAVANLEYQTSNRDRNLALYEKELLAKSDYDLVVYNYKISVAEVKSAEANLDRAQRNLSYASIYAPIDGVVLNRAVEEGQTVAASMSTPELYTITNDLSTMQVEADVDETDIGMVALNQRVEFGVDAFPEMTFEGEVSEIRLQPNESSNVITYTVIITVGNDALKLKPGMTADLTVYVEEAKDVMTVASKAFRFNPDHELLEKYMNSLSDELRTEFPMSEGKGKRPEPGQNGKSGDRPNGPGMGMPPHELGEMNDQMKMVWIKDGESIRPAMVEIGIDDGSNVEVISGLKEGDLVVTSLEVGTAEEVLANDEDSNKSPFIQSGPGGKRSGPPM